MLVHDHPQHALHNHTIDPPSPVPHHNMNLLGVLIHLIGDAINSWMPFSYLLESISQLCVDVAVIISAIIIWKVQSPHRFYVDPAVSLAISLIIFGSAIPMSSSIYVVSILMDTNHLPLQL